MKILGASFVVALFALTGSGCSTDESPPHYTYPDTGGTRRDGYKPLFQDTGTVYWDTNKQKDKSVASPDHRVDGSTIDGAPPDCPGPTAASCKTACASDEICTEANGGTCVKTMVLNGAVSSKAVLVAFTMAYVKCWAKAPGANTLCYTFDACGMTGMLTESAISDWVCNKAQVTDFPSSTDYDSARGLCKCSIWQGQFVYRPEWSITNIIPNKKGDVCLSYHSNPWYEFDRLYVGSCSGFPPP
jgi:hypothetical protein